MNNSYLLGTFHMWEQLGVPIIPLIFYGAYELYPNGSWVNNTGKISVTVIQQRIYISISFVEYYLNEL